MCSLYNMTTNQQALGRCLRSHWVSLDNPEPGLDLYIDRIASAGCCTGQSRELTRLIGEHKLFAFRTGEANGVGPAHPEARPVILTMQGEIDMRFMADWLLTRVLQRRLPDDQPLLVQ